VIAADQRKLIRVGAMTSASGALRRLTARLCRAA